MEFPAQTFKTKAATMVFYNLFSHFIEIPTFSCLKRRGGKELNFDKKQSSFFSELRLGINIYAKFPFLMVQTPHPPHQY